MRGRLLNFLVKVLSWRIVMTVTLDSLIKGPEPMSVVAPIGGPKVAFSCTVNRNDVPANAVFFWFLSWIVNGVELRFSIDQTNNRSLAIGILQLSVLPDYISGVPVQCQIYLLVSGVPTFIRSNNATLTAYGKIWNVVYNECIFSTYRST